MNAFLEHFTSPQGLLFDTTALAAVTALGYMFGRGTRTKSPPLDSTLLGELHRAQQIVEQLDQISLRIRAEAAAHRGRLATFHEQLSNMQSGAVAADWRRLSDGADALVSPTMKLATNLSQAFDELRQHQAQLLTFANSRIDPATGLQNRRAMEEQLDAQLSLHAEGSRRFSVGLFSISSARPTAEMAHGGRLRAIARLLEDCIRDSDIVARYSDDEFVVLMPQTTLAGALVFTERLINRAQADLCCPLWGGIVEAQTNETPDKLLSRADSALYSARTQPGPCVFQHNGLQARKHSLAHNSADARSEGQQGAPEPGNTDVELAVCGRAG